jgi:hypothetical protein
MSGSLIAGAIPPVLDDGDLESLLTDMDLSVPRTTVRRTRGVETLGGGGGNEIQGENAGFETPGTWHHTRQGTSDSVLSPSVYGQAETVVSQDRSHRIPSSVSAKAPAEAPGKRFKLFRAPQDERGFGKMCRSLIGQGTTFCTAKNCNTSHQGQELNAAPGELFVAKTPTSAFADPRAHFMDLTPELWLDWNNRSYTLEEWSRLFMLVNNRDDEEGPTSAAGLEAQATFADKAEARRTPAKRKAEDLDDSWMNTSPYKRQIGDDVLEVPSALGQESEEVLRVLMNLDQGLA